MALENWKPVVGFEDRYEVSDLGRVRTTCVRTGKGTRRNSIILKPRLKNNYWQVALSRADGTSTGKCIHVIVAEAFLGPRPVGHLCCHDNDDRDDNRLVNLKWGTPTQNYADRARNGGDVRGERNGRATITRATAENIKRRLKADEEASEIARDLGVARTIVTNIQCGQGWAWLEV